MLLVQLDEAVRPQGGAGQSLAEDGVDRGRFEPEEQQKQTNKKHPSILRNAAGKRSAPPSTAADPPVLGVRAEQRGEHHHLVLAGGDLGHRQDLVLGLRVADVQHGGGAGLVLAQRARRAVAHRHGEVGRQLTFDVLRRHLERRWTGRTSRGRSVRSHFAIISVH